MSAVDENIVREYFELHGFLVCQRRKYIVQARQKSADEEVDLIVLNPGDPARGRAGQSLKLLPRHCRKCHGRLSR